MSNAVVIENRLPGHPPTEWDINGAGDPSIQGFGHDISINRGETIYFKIFGIVNMNIFVFSVIV